ncbi:hypothetical protein [Defluviitalea raffinosedens]|uniref:hypothetical protein n=1 Tax=Defluviitalea raffinosedens TaxID=1450156 RepID=UPI001959580A|nr:hypothetical protein [Defluviitalea raffinosedens]MBM7685885.1 hypothetical protein [Defluviitalea raffinosedens]
MTQGILKVDRASTPDRIRFTNWTRATNNIWDYEVPPGQSNGDSAVCLYWNERSLDQGEVLECKTFCGLGPLQRALSAYLTVGLVGTTKIGVIKDENGIAEYSPNPFIVTAYVQNIGK